MSVKQYVALSEQAARTALDGSPAYLFYPVKGKLEPEPDFKEDAVKEWRAQDTAQGDTSDERTSTAWKYSLEGRIYPGDELALLMRHLLGYADTAVALDAPNAAASLQMFRTATEMYGDDAQNLDKALAIIPNTAKGTSTYSQAFVGGRPNSAELNFKGGDAAEIKINLTGGPWIGAVEQTAIAGVAFPAAKAFRSVPKVYLGSGATLTGTAPDYTDFTAGTMALVKPDDLMIKLEPGIEDVYKMNGIEGPSVTERKKQWSLSIEYTHDFSDPASGWSSYDAWAARFADIQYLPCMIILDSSEVIPSCSTQTYQLAFYLPKMKLTVDMPDRKNDGSKSKTKVKLESRVDASVNVAAFAKLIY
ncbi:MAG: hypothetical protein PHN84_03320 [Desulfuromonadaceae bacterium]|nr:hypothetical protein [Desulfuromonadaceae bacterium]